MSDIIATNMRYTQKDGDRMEPEGVHLEVAQRIMSQLSPMLSEGVMGDASVHEDGVMLEISHSTRWSRDDDGESYPIESLLTWDALLNGDIYQWYNNVQRADLAKSEQKIIAEKLRAKEAEECEVKRRAENQRKADLATYERIKAEMNSGPEECLG